MPRARKASFYSLLFVYVLPYFLYVGGLMLPLEKPAGYAVAFVASAAALAWGWRWYVPLVGPGSPLASIAIGALAGVVGTGLWVAIKAPTIGLATHLGIEPPKPDAWAPAAFWARLAVSGTVVAVFEELLFRGWILRLAVAWDRLRQAGSKDPLGEALHDRTPSAIEPGAWTPLAVGISSLAFMSGHSWKWEFPAAFAYGVLMCGLWIWRKDLLTCVVAHGVTNVTLALWVRHAGSWGVW